MKNALILFTLTLILTFNVSLSFAGWLIYHKPEFKGKVIDAETKEPIEGAAVVAIYEKHTLISGPGGGYSSVIKVKETLTDKSGDFYFPSYTTIIQPNSIEDTAEFIIYKPGYGSFPEYQITPSGIAPVNQQVFFSKEIGSKGELELWVKGEKGPELRKAKVIFGIVELPKLKTKEERLKAITYPLGDVKSKEIPLLYKAINEERRQFGLEAVGEGNQQ